MCSALILLNIQVQRLRPMFDVLLARQVLVLEVADLCWEPLLIERDRTWADVFLVKRLSWNFFGLTLVFFFFFLISF